MVWDYDSSLPLLIITVIYKILFFENLVYFSLSCGISTCNNTGNFRGHLENSYYLFETQIIPLGDNIEKKCFIILNVIICTR